MSTQTLEFQNQDWDLISPVIKLDPSRMAGTYILAEKAADLAYQKFCVELRYPERVYRDIADMLSMMAGESEPPQVELMQVLYFFQNLFFALREGDSSVLMQKRGLRVRRIVGIEEFVKAKDFMNQKRSVRKPVMQKLIDLYEGPGSDRFMEVVLGGGIGWGKNYFSDMVMSYETYKLSCFHSPQLEFGLAPGSNIILIVQSKKMDLAKKVAFDQLGARMMEGTYFRVHFPFNPKVKSEMRFPNGIIILPITTTDTSALGMNVFGGLIDEMNFMSRIRNSVATRFTGEEEYDQAEKLYTTAVRRMVSRYQVLGKVPGKLILVSSANYPDAFIERKAAEAKVQLQAHGYTHIFVAKMAQWESQAAHRLSKETFLVEVGNEIKQSRMIESVKQAVDPADVISVPMDYKIYFERDLDGSIRDIAGIAVGGKGVFIRQREKIVEAYEKHTQVFQGRQLFTLSSVDLSQFSERLEDLLDTEYLKSISDPDMVFASHTDLALTGDSAGLAIGHVMGYTKIGTVRNWDEGTQKYVEVSSGEHPVICIDGVLEIVPPANDEIDLYAVGRLLTTIASRINLMYASADSFQSAAMLQHVRKGRNVRGNLIRSWVMSVDSALAPYASVKQALRDSRFLFPNVEKVAKELRELELDAKHMKVDHPPLGSKDVADCLAGVSHTLSSYRMIKRPSRGDEAEEGTRQLRRRPW